MHPLLSHKGAQAGSEHPLLDLLYYNYSNTNLTEHRIDQKPHLIHLIVPENGDQLHAHKRKLRAGIIHKGKAVQGETVYLAVFVKF